MKVKQTSWSEHWKLKKINWWKKSKKCKKCSPSLIWANWIPVCSATNWKNWMRPEKSSDITQKSWMIWQWPKRKSLSMKSKSFNRMLNLTNQSPTYQTLTKTHSWAERSIMKLIRKTLKLVREVSSLQMTYKSGAWVSGRTTLLLRNKTSSFLWLLWTLGKTATCTWMGTVWHRKLKYITWIVFRLEQITCS